jgi:hypothetical protein
MTWALCLNCGEVKFGAICPCPRCNIASTGNMSLDIAFSDHHLSKDSLGQLGKVVEAIHRGSSDKELCFWTFIHYIATAHPSILGVELEPAMRSRAEQLLGGLQLPPVDLASGPRAAGSSRSDRKKRWWQFWKG